MSFLIGKVLCPECKLAGMNIRESKFVMFIGFKIVVEFKKYICRCGGIRWKANKG